MASVKAQGLIAGFVAAARSDGSFPALVTLARPHGFMADLLADARRAGYLADLLAAAHSPGQFADLIAAADPLEELLRDCKPMSYFLLALFDAAHASGLLPQVLSASYLTGQIADLITWATQRDLLGEIIEAARLGDTVGELLEHVTALGYMGDILAAASPAFVDAAQGYDAGIYDASVQNFKRDADSIPVLDHPYRTILGEVEIDLEARRDPFAFGSVADRLITMADEVGANLREKYGTTGAARLIHRKSRPDAPGLMCDEHTPVGWIVAYLRERAAEEPAIIEETAAVA